MEERICDYLNYRGSNSLRTMCYYYLFQDPYEDFRTLNLLKKFIMYQICCQCTSQKSKIKVNYYFIILGT